MRRTGALVLALAATVTLSFHASPADAKAKYKRYANCAAMHKDYPHGVGRKGAKDRDKHGRPVKHPVRNFTVNTGLYNAQYKRSDADHDGIACEQ